MASLVPGNPGEAAACAAVLFAALQVVLSGWRDLGPGTVGLAGIALVVGPRDTYVALAVALAAVLGAGAWARGAGRGVGRPALTGAVLAVVTCAAMVPGVLGDLLGPAWTARATDVAVPVVVLVTAVCTGVSLERPGPRRMRWKWLGRIPVRAATR